MAILIQPLLYDCDALEPYISVATLGTHYKKHYKGYVEKLNELIKGTPYVKMPLEQIVLESAFKSESPIEKKIFNNSSQAWNHAFFWDCLTPAKNQMPSKALLKVLNKNFGSKEKFIEEFSERAIELFGCGWVWLVKNQDSTLEVFCVSNAESPLVHGKVPLLNCDVWEHAYYLDYKNKRKTYLQKFWKLVNWNFVENCLENTNSLPMLQESKAKIKRRNKNER